jgi:hypothetical protein
VVVERNPVPLTVRVSGPAPAIAAVGVIELTVGAVTGGGVVPPEFDDPPQPVRKIADVERQKDKRSPAKFFMTGQYSLKLAISQ